MLAYAHRVEQPFPQSAGVRTLSCMRAFDQFPKTLAYADRVEQPFPQSVGVRTLSCMLAFDPFPKTLAYADRVEQPLPQSVGVCTLSWMSGLACLPEMLTYADRVGKPLPQSVGVCSTFVTPLQRNHRVRRKRVHNAPAYAVPLCNHARFGCGRPVRRMSHRRPRGSTFNIGGSTCTLGVGHVGRLNRGVGRLSVVPVLLVLLVLLVVVVLLLY